jgi:Domain of unknown function (DUF1883).
MQSENTKKLNGLIPLAVLIVLVASALALIIVADNQYSYWTLNIDTPNGWNVTPNGTVHVLANQEGINVTVNKAPFGASGWWRLDGSDFSSFEGTITVPKQAAGSNHTLNVIWIQPTPVLVPVTNGETHINPGDYEAYNFTAPANMKNSIVANINASSIIKVYVMDEANFAVWKNEKSADYITIIGANCTIDYLSIPTDGVYYLVLDNTSNQNVCTVSATVTLQYIPVTVVVHG